MVQLDRLTRVQSVSDRAGNRANGETPAAAGAVWECARRRATARARSRAPCSHGDISKSEAAAESAPVESVPTHTCRASRGLRRSPRAPEGTPRLPLPSWHTERSTGPLQETIVAYTAEPLIGDGGKGAAAQPDGSSSHLQRRCACCRRRASHLLLAEVPPCARRCTLLSYAEQHRRLFCRASAPAA